MDRTRHPAGDLERSGRHHQLRAPRSCAHLPIAVGAQHLSTAVVDHVIMSMP